jgi:hypothetical protein
MNLFKIDFVGQESEKENVHQDVAYIKRFGWLSARYRRTRWWFFAFWIIYQFVRACFVGGARANPTAQVIGLFIWEFIAFIIVICINPFEGKRNTALAVYMLGISKVVTSGLSIAFLPQFNVARIPTTVIGVIIIVVQGFLVVGLLILIVLGAFSTYMSLTRNRKVFHPSKMENVRIKYFTHLETKEKDVPPPPPPPPPVPEEPKEPYFSVNTVRRAPKIEDEDEDALPEMNENNPAESSLSVQGPVQGPNRHSRANSMANSMRSHYSYYGNVPYGARVHRASWSSRDFQNWQEGDMNRSESPLKRGESPFVTPSRVGSGHNTANNSVSRTPLVRPSQSSTSMRPSTPTRDQQHRYSSQRLNHGQ